MTVPYTIPLEAGGAACVSVIGKSVLLVVPRSGAVMTRAECEHLGDALWQAGITAEPPKSMGLPRAEPIKIVGDERVKGAP